MLNTEINYLIALDNDDGFSPFQGYSLSLLGEEKGTQLNTDADE